MARTATYDPETQTFTLRGTGWHDTYPISDLPKWLAIYRKMDEDFPKSKGVYRNRPIATACLTLGRSAMGRA